MKKLLFSAWMLAFGAWCAVAQVTTEPAFITNNYTGKIIITFDPAQGNKGMVGATACYAHTGACTATQDWQCDPEWRSALDKHKMTKVGDKWQLVIDNMYEYYDCLEEGEVITKLAFVFNDGKSGTKEGKTADGKDIFVTVYEAGLNVAFDAPATKSQLVKSGTAITFSAQASESSTLTFSINGTVKKTATGTTLSHSETFSATGNYECIVEAKTTTETAADTITICVANTAAQQTRPAGIVNGIYYDTKDNTKVTLCTYAASKTEPAQNVFVVGDFNNWTISTDYQMKRDGNYFWTEITGLTPQKEYAFQYVVVRSDGKTVRISDLFSEKVLHPDDKYEPTTVDSDIMPYPEGKADGYVTVIQTDKPQFAWSDATLNFKRPNKNNLIIYEVWVYDFTPDRSYKGLMERLDYIENLGVNALELMPICEFDGNYNWGYSPNHYFAPDRAYGSENDLKTLIDECHKRGIAVIVDMVFNHATGNNPMNKLYPYGTDLKNNPWFNVTAPHGSNVYEDWNHDFEPAKDMFKRSLQYWLEEYKIDGYRMDLAQGFCGPSKSSVGTNLTDYNNTVNATSSDAYFILEYWNETGMPSQQEMVNKGMICWAGGNLANNAYCQTAMGWLKDGDGLDDCGANAGDGYVTYCNSHDEERPFFKAKQFGAGDLQTSVSARSHRVPLNIAFNVLLNGSHMFYQYDELGYDYSKYQDEYERFGKDDDGNYGLKPSVDADTKTGKKPRPESRGYFEQGPRMQAYRQVAQLIQLRTRLLPDVFSGNPTAATIGSGKAIRTIQWGNNVYVVGNFSATAAQTATLPAGTWYDYLSGSATTVAGGASVTLQPGDLKIYTATKQALPTVPDSYDYEYVGLPTIGTDNASRNFIYPTMADDIIYIASDDTPRRIEIVSISGTRAARLESDGTVNVSGLPRGIYLMVVTFDKQQEAFKFIKK